MRRVATGEMNTFINCTPHDVVLFDGNDRAVKRWPSATAWARLPEQHNPVRDVLIDDAVVVPIVDVSYQSGVANLPANQPGTLLIVSRPLAMVVRRNDLVFPLDEVRDKAGRIIGCRALGRFTRTPSHA